MSHKFYVPMIYDSVEQTYKTGMKMVQPAYTPVAENTVTYSTVGSSTFAVPDDVTRLLVEVASGGGGGGYAYDAEIFWAGGDGGDGGVNRFYMDVTPGQQISLTVGAGGAIGQNGGQSAFNGITAEVGTWATGDINGKDGATNTGYPGGLGGYGQVSTSSSPTVGQKGWVKVTYGGNVQKPPIKCYAFVREVVS